jgi:hypothetical protein
MALNISKYQLPYLEYSLFNDYIVENLCVQKDKANNCCHGKCFLEKQIGLVNETEDNTSNPTEKKTVNWNETDNYVVDKTVLQESKHFIKKQLPSFVDILIKKMEMDVPCPPPKHIA